jgi:hypothetical protein
MRTFGVLCEYQFSQNRFESTILSQYTQKGRYPLGSQLFGTTTCYKTSFPCDYGTICLEWRNICDGKYRVFLKSLPKSFFVYLVLFKENITDMYNLKIRITEKFEAIEKKTLDNIFLQMEKGLNFCISAQNNNF